MHGGEYEGPVTLMKLGRDLHPSDVQGRVIITPSLNLPAVLAGQRLSPIDHKDMNRVFPGLWNGTITQIIAHYVHEAILPLADAVLDIHSGGYSLELLPYISMHYLDDEQQHTDTLAALKAFHAPTAMIMNEFSGAGLLDYAVEDMGKVFLCAEIGGGGRLSVDLLKIAQHGTYNLLKHFDIIDGDPVPWQDGTRFLEIPDAANYHSALGNGIYEPFFNLGEIVEAGQTLGEIHFTEDPSYPPKPVIAGRNGVLMGVRSPAHVERGDCVALVANESTPTLN